MRVVQHPDGISPDLIEWEEARALWLYGNLPIPGRPVRFSLSAVMKHDAQMIVKEGTNADELRVLARNLAAQHRVPFDDNTSPHLDRAATDGGGFTNDLRYTLESEEGDLLSGTFAHYCHLCGMSIAAFEAVLQEAKIDAGRWALSARHDPEEVESALEYCADHERDTFLILRAANPTPEGEGAKA